MSGATRRHPGRFRHPPVGPKLTRVEPGSYVTPDGTRLENRNDGKNEACWVAQGPDGALIAWAETLRNLRRKLATKVIRVKIGTMPAEYLPLVGKVLPAVGEWFEVRERDKAHPTSVYCDLIKRVGNEDLFYASR